MYMTGDDLHQAITTGILFAFMFIMYFLPTIIAMFTQRRTRWLFIFVFNLLLGWTFLIWGVCMLLAIIPSNRVRSFEK